MRFSTTLFVATTAGAFATVVGLSAASAATPGTTSAPNAASGPSVTMDEGLHVSKGTVIGMDSPSGVTVPVYAKWHQYDATGITAESGSGKNYDANYRLIGTLGFSGVRTTYNYTAVAGGSSNLTVTATNKGGYSGSDYGYFDVNLVQDGEADYSAGWTTGKGAIWSGGGIHRSSKAGQWASFTATGNQFALVTDKGPGRGTANVFLDGKKFASINDLSTASVNRVIDAQVYKVVPGKHTLKVVVTSGRIDIDALIVS